MKSVASILSRGKSKNIEWLTFANAEQEIARALKIKREAALMTLFGLCAIGDVRVADANGEVIEEGEYMIGDIVEIRHLRVAAGDLHAWLADVSAAPQRSALKEAITRRVNAGEVPGDTITWARFCDLIRKDCNGYVRTGGKPQPSRGFGDKTIKRAVADLQDE
jgi:hypothetical protein